MNLREYAQGKPCLYRGPGCLGGGETVVLCHVRRANVAGISQKPPDTCAFWGCARCHDLYDRRARIANLTNTELELMAFDAVIRTLAELHKAGKLKVMK